MSRGSDAIALLEKKHGVVLPTEHRRFLEEEAWRGRDGRYPGDIPVFRATNGGPRLFFLVGDDVPGHPAGQGFLAGKGPADLFPGAPPESRGRYVPFSALVNPKDGLMVSLLVVDVTAGERAPVLLFKDGVFHPMADSIGAVLSDLRTADQPARVEVLEAAVEGCKEPIAEGRYREARDLLSAAIALFAGRPVREGAVALRHELGLAYLYRGSCQEHLGDPDQAEADYRAAMASSPDYDRVPVHLTSLLLSVGRAAEACRVATVALKRPPSGEEEFELLVVLTLGSIVLGKGAEAVRHAKAVEKRFAHDKKWKRLFLQRIAAFAKEHPEHAHHADAVVRALGGSPAPAGRKAAKAKSDPVEAAQDAGPAIRFSAPRQAILDAHRDWVGSGGERGTRFVAAFLPEFADGEGAIVLRGAALQRADLQFADHEAQPVDFGDSDLTGAEVTGANFLGSRFDGAVLAGVVFAESTFEGASFARADLRGADLRGADLHAWGALTGALYDRATRFDEGFDPAGAGMRRAGGRRR